MKSAAIALVERYWELMATNGFHRVGAVLSDEDYPAPTNQSHLVEPLG